MTSPGRLLGSLITRASASFSADADTETRNLLIGGIVASASGVVAFSFASRVADPAAAQPTSVVTAGNLRPALDPAIRSGHG